MKILVYIYCFHDQFLIFFFENLQNHKKEEVRFSKSLLLPKFLHMFNNLLVQSRVYKEVTQLSDFFVTTTISLHAKILSHRDVLFFLYGVCRLPLVKCKLRTMTYYHWVQYTKSGDSVLGLQKHNELYYYKPVCIEQSKNINFLTKK
jgi:hypothetical protein